MFIEFDCKQCGAHVRKQQVKGMQHAFCSRQCKAEWQRTQKPVDREWLYQKYVVEQLDCTQIAALVNRNSKRVWEWLRDYGIPTRSRGTTGNWKYSTHRKGFIQSEATRHKIREARLKDGRVPYLKNGTHHLKGKRGADTPNWRGGVTPLRQTVQQSAEWKAAVKAVWKRDNATCQRCGLPHSKAKEQAIGFDVHHIVSFSVEALRCEPSNLILVCKSCHRWIHSRANTSKEFLG